MEEIWAKLKCGCGTINWVYCGDATDITGHCPESWQCRSCGKKRWLQGVEEYLKIVNGEAILEDSDCELGKELPT